MIWRVILDSLSRGVFFFINILIARTLPMEEFGRFAYAISISQVFYIFTDMGIHLRLIKEQGLDRAKGKDVWCEYLKLKIVLGLACFVLFVLLLPWLWHWSSSYLAVLALLWMMSNSFLDFFQFVCNGLGRMDLARKVLVFSRTSVVLGVVIPLFMFRSLSAVLMGAALGGSLGVFLSYYLVKQFSGVAPSWDWKWINIKNILKNSIPLGIGGAFGGWYLRVGVIILAWVSTAHVIGEYSAAFRIFEITYILPAAIMSIGVPHLSESLRKGPVVFFREIKHLFLLMATAGGLWSLFIVVFKEQLILLLFGRSFQGAVFLLAMFAIVGFFVFLNYLVTHIMVVLDFQNRHAINQVIVFSVCLLASVIWVPQQFSLGAVRAILLAEVILFFLTLTSLYRYFSTVRKHGGFDTIPTNDK